VNTRVAACLAVLVVGIGATSAATALTLDGRQPGDAAALLSPNWTDEQAPAAVARPVRLRIPAIGVDSAIVDIGVDAAGALVPPERPDLVGWFAGGPAPGGVGPTVLAGHVDSRTGPAVFYHLANLRPGDTVTIERADASTASFTVVSRRRVAKAAFPTDLVYAPLPVPLLRLVTCGGTFDRAASSYRDNVIVEAAAA
jgi:sortase (surface protein transpeptidase)